ncbi:MAG: DUF2029 domain-containing protein [Chloroflexi bacterium]|nr:DUF2029 domain-containing protein [Chloroflexota bacterium]
MNRKNILLALLILILFAVSVVGMYAAFTSKVPGANDFYSRWKGAQLFWVEGIDPYSQEASEAIQVGMYGRLATPEEDQVLFVYPFYTTFLLIPLVWFEYAWVQAFWLVTIQFALLGGVILTLKLLDWQMRPWLLGLTLLWTIIFYNSARTIILGQFAGLIFLWMAACLLALKHDRDILAGLLLALTTIKPQMSFLLIPALLLWALGQKRWQFMGSFAGALAVLVGLSFILLPSWLTGFMDQVSYYPAYTITGSPLWVITGYYFPWLGKPVEYALIGLLLVYMLWQWRGLWGETAVNNHFLYIIGITLIVTNMIVVRTATTNYVIMYIPLFMALREVSGRVKWGNVWVALFFGFSFVGMWVLFLGSISGDQEHPITYLPLPFLLLLVLNQVEFIRD